MSSCRFFRCCSSDQVIEAPTSCSLMLRALALRIEVIYNLIVSFAKSLLSSGILLTIILGGDTVFLDMSLNAMLTAVPIAIIFAIAEVLAHFRQSSHFDRTEARRYVDSLDIEGGNSDQISLDPLHHSAESPDNNAQLSNDQFTAIYHDGSLSVRDSLAIFIHFLSDVFQEAALPMAFILEGIKFFTHTLNGANPITPTPIKAAVAIGSCLFSALGQTHSLLNDITAFREHNRENALASGYGHRH